VHARVPKACLAQLQVGSSVFNAGCQQRPRLNKVWLAVVAVQVGIEICGALKNVLAVGAGIVQGLGLGQNALAAFIVQGCSEIRFVCGGLKGGRCVCFLCVHVFGWVGARVWTSVGVGGRVCVEECGCGWKSVRGRVYVCVEECVGGWKSVCGCA